MSLIVVDIEALIRWTPLVDLRICLDGERTVCRDESAEINAKFNGIILRIVANVFECVSSNAHLRRLAHYL